MHSMFMQKEYCKKNNILHWKNILCTTYVCTLSGKKMYKKVIILKKNIPLHSKQRLMIVLFIFFFVIFFRSIETLKTVL